MAKYTYNIIVNDVDLSDYQMFRYKYSRMEMQINVSADSFIIIYETNVAKTANEIWYSREVEDAVRKSLLVQLIFYGHNCDFRKVLIKESGCSDFTIIEQPRVYNLIPSNVTVDLTPIRDKEFVAEYLMKRVKSDYESGIAAVFSYIYAKSKRCEEDMFTYFWRSFNGIYSSIAKESVDAGSLGKDQMKKENELLKNWLKNRSAQNFMVSSLFSKVYAQGNDYSVVERKSKHFFYQIRNKAAAAKWTKEDVRNTLNAPGNKNMNLAKLLNLEEYINPTYPDSMQLELEGKKYTSRSTLYGYLMTELAYQIRCSYFHAEKPILLHTTLNNPEFRGLELANALLEHYLDKHIKDEVIAKIKLERKISSSPL